MAAIKMPQFFEGGIKTDGTLVVDGNSTFNSRMIFGAKGTFMIPAGTGNSGNQYELRYNPSTKSLQIYDDSWVAPFTSAVSYDETTGTFKVTDSDGESNTILTLSSNAVFSLAEKIINGVGSVTAPSYTFDEVNGSGFSCDASNGTVNVSVSQGKVLAVKPSGVTVRSYSQNDSEFIANFEMGGSDINSDLDVDGDLGITGTLSIDGTVVSASNITAFSDKRIKDIIGKLNPETCLEAIESLDAYTYHNKLTGNTETGLIADEVMKVLPSAVKINKGEFKGYTDLKSVDTYSLLSVLCAAVSSLSKKVNGGD